MRTTPPLPLSHDRPPEVLADRTSISLRAHAIQLDITANYGLLLEQTIFDRTIDGVDHKNDKLYQSYRRTLKTIDAYRILAILWKESEFITDNDLEMAGMRRLYQGRHLTAHGLAVELAEVGREVAALNTRIRMIAVAASAYELVDRDAVNSTTVSLKGTLILHEFMMLLSAKNIQTMAKFEGFIAEVTPTTDLTNR
jgi:hypothetical protein